MSTPSALQKRDWAKGVSLLMLRTTTPPSFLISSLNFLAEVAHVEVSRLGTILRILTLPAKSANPASLRSPRASLKSGALDPTLGSSPTL